jgi:glycosyltransferase involved in cell wall biosynthesis
MTGALLQNDRLLRVAINAQILPNGGAGGVESVLIGLISALGQLVDGPEEYIIIGPWQEPDWLQPYLGPNQRIVRGPQPPQQMAWKPGPLEPLKRALGPLRPPLRAIWRELFPVPPPPPPRLWPEVPVSDGFYESLGCDVIYFPWQSFTLCALPSIYNPHDLQHLHYPQFFTPQTVAWRETIYPAGCHFAHTAVVGSQWVKQDVVRHYRVDSEKIQVIPWAPPTQAYPNPSDEKLAAVTARYQLHRPSAFYPAMTWEHKNHLRLLDALAYLRDREGLVVRLVCTGNHYPGFWPRIEAHLSNLNLNGQVQFLGRVPPEDLRAIYRLAQFVIVPTLFEAASGPVFEAWREGIPVGCSTVTSLPEQVGDAALLFDPYSVEAIADAVRRMATDEPLRNELIRKGQRRLQDFSWVRTAKAYRAVYRRAARRPLTEEDRYLLSWDWMRDPRPAEKGAS